MSAAEDEPIEPVTTVPFFRVDGNGSRYVKVEAGIETVDGEIVDYTVQATVPIWQAPQAIETARTWHKREFEHRIKASAEEQPETDDGDRRDMARAGPGGEG